MCLHSNNTDQEINCKSGSVLSIVSSFIPPHGPPEECSWKCILLYYTGVARLFCYPDGFEEKEHSWFPKQKIGHSFIVWSPARNLALAIFGAI